jgi:hypothetical protein
VEILVFLDNSEIVKKYFVKDFITFETGFFIKVIVTFTNNSLLFISEYVDENERNYSYHWQDKNNDIILRFDNAPYHPDIITYPHHLHSGTVIEPNHKISSLEILSLIEKYYFEYLS